MNFASPRVEPASESRRTKRFLAAFLRKELLSMGKIASHSESTFSLRRLGTKSMQKPRWWRFKNGTQTDLFRRRCRSALLAGSNSTSGERVRTVFGRSRFYGHEGAGLCL